MTRRPNQTMKRIFTDCLCIAASAVFTASPLLAQRADVPLNEAGRRIMLAAPAPEYPAEARTKRISGAGLYDVQMRVKTGIVTRVAVLRSTGSKLLDDAAVRALKQWRARPNTVSHINVPVRFTL